MANSQKPIDLPIENIKYEDLQKLRELTARINKGDAFDSAAFNQLFVSDTAKFLQNLAISQVALPQGHLPYIPKEVVARAKSRRGNAPARLVTPRRTGTRRPSPGSGIPSRPRSHASSASLTASASAT